MSPARWIRSRRDRRICFGRRSPATAATSSQCCSCARTRAGRTGNGRLHHRHRARRRPYSWPRRRRVDQVLAARRPGSRPVLLANAVLFFLVSGLVAATLTFVGLLLSGIEPAGVGTPELVILGLGIVSCAAGQVGYSFLLGVERLRQLAFVTGCASWVYALLVFVLWAGPGLTVGRAALAWTATEGLRAVVLIFSEPRDAPRPSEAQSPPRGGQVRHQALGGEPREVPELPHRPDPDGLHRIRGGARLLRGRRQRLRGAAVLAVLGCGGIAPVGRPHGARPTGRGDAPGVQVGRVCHRSRRRRRGPARARDTAGRLRRPLPGVGRPLPVAPPRHPGLRGQRVFSNALVGSSSPGLSSLGPIVSLALGFGLDLALIPPFGASGAAAAASAAFLAGGATALVTYRR